MRGKGALRGLGLENGCFYSFPSEGGLSLWEGEHEGQKNTWLRWVDENTGVLIATGAERADVESKRANTE